MFGKKIHKLTIIIMFFGVLALCIEPVFAINCNGLITSDAADFIGEIMGWIQILVPALLIVLGAIDFGSVVISDDKDGMKKASSRFVKRCISGVAIFFVPLVVKVLLDISGITGTLVDDPMCGIIEDGD